MTSSEIVIRVHAYPSRRRRALGALFPQAFAFLMALVFIAAVLASA